MTRSIPTTEIQVLPHHASLAARLAVLLYGTAVYALFLVTFLYAIGFVMGFGVPKDIDGGATAPLVPAPLVPALLVNGLFLAAFAIQHTIMARPAFKVAFTRVIPPAAERSTFVLVTCVILCSMFAFWRPLPQVVWSVSHPVAVWALYGVSALGWSTVLVSTFLIDHFELFGLRQVVDAFRQAPPARPDFEERSLYRFVRHPLLLGFLVAFWATPVMTVGHLFFAAMCTGYVLMGIQFEERDLLKAHGDSYRRYRRRVPMLLPWRLGR